MSSSSSIKRHNYSVSLKLEVIDRYRELNKNMSKTSKEFNIPRSVIYGWINQEDKLRSSDLKRTSKRVKRKHTLKYDQLETDVLRFVRSERAAKRSISYRQIVAYALEINSQKFKHPDFKASQGWLWRFMKRNKLGRRAKTKVSQLCRFDSIAEQQTAINEFLNTVPGRMKPYSDTVTFNMDETPCYFDMSNAHTIEFKGAKTVEIMGTGLSKRRFTVVLCIRMDGKVIDVMVIFKGLKKMQKIDELPKNIVVTVAKGGSMKYDIMMEWIDKVWSVRGNYFAHTKSILYMDQYGTHVRDEIVNYLRDQYGTECFWIPKRLTSVLQPLDVVVNAPFKAYMRQQWSRWFADPEKHFYTRAGNRKPPSYSEIVKFVSDAVKELNSDTVKKSFRVCGIAEKGDRIELNELHGRLRTLVECKEEEKAEVLEGNSEDESECDDEIIPIDDGGDELQDSSLDDEKF